MEIKLSNILKTTNAMTMAETILKWTVQFTKAIQIWAAFNVKIVGTFILF